MKTKRLLSVLSLAVLLPFAASADVWQDPETKVNYEYTVGKSEASVKADYSSAGSPDVSGDIVILSVFSVDGNEYRVTSIGSSAFYECSNMTSVTIPSSVTKIGNDAFCGCRGLTSVTIPGSVTNIGSWAFEDCSGLTSVTILGGYIGDGAFKDCNGLASVTIGNSVGGIGYDAFLGCTALTSVHISDIAAWCSMLFDEGYSNPLRLAHRLYLEEEEIKDLVIPDGVKRIGRSFYGCSGLTSIVIPSSVTYIEWDAFSGCYFLYDSFINYSTCNNYGNNWDITFVDKETEDGLLINNNVVVKCRPWATSVTIPNSVTGINEYAFVKCRDLTSVMIPNSVTSIGNNAFFGCSGLASVMIPNSVTSIGFQAFEGCISLTSVTISNSVMSIGQRAFSGCISLTSVTSLIMKPFSISNVFSSDTYNTATLYVPIGTIETYMATNGWKDFTTIIEKDFSEQPKGDVNGDGTVDVADIAAVIDAMASTTTSGASVSGKADVNGDGTVDVADIAAIIDEMAADARGIKQED